MAMTLQHKLARHVSSMPASVFRGQDVESSESSVDDPRSSNASPALLAEIAHAQSGLFTEATRRHRQQQRVLDKVSFLSAITASHERSTQSSPLSGGTGRSGRSMVPPSDGTSSPDVDRLSDFCASIVDELQQLQSTIACTQSRQRVLREEAAEFADGRSRQSCVPCSQVPQCETSSQSPPRSVPVLPAALPKGLDSPRMRWGLQKARFVAACPSREDRISRASSTVGRERHQTWVGPSLNRRASVQMVGPIERQSRSHTQPLPHLLGRRAGRSTSAGACLKAPFSLDSRLCIPHRHQKFGEEAGSESDSSNEIHNSTRKQVWVAESYAMAASTADASSTTQSTGCHRAYTHNGGDKEKSCSAVCADAAAGPASGISSMSTALHQEDVHKIKEPPKRRSSLDSGGSHVDGISAGSPSIAPTRLSSWLWSSASINVFMLQKDLFQAHAEAPGPPQEMPGLEIQYVGVKCMQKFQQRFDWCDRGSAFRWLGVALKVLGTIMVHQPYAQTCDQVTLVKLQHYASLAYLVAWQLGLWLILLAHITCALVERRHAPIRYGNTVQMLLLFASASAHLANIKFYASAAFVDLCSYATRSVFVVSWSAASKRVAIALVLPVLVLAGTSALVHGWTFALAAHIVTWIPLMVQLHIFLTTIQFCSLGLDAFALELLNTTILEGLVARFDKLHAAMRRSAYAVQLGLTIFVASLSATLFATFSHSMFTGFEKPSDSTSNSVPVPWAKAEDAAAILSVIVLFLLGLHLLNQIAMVNAKCKRLPALIQSLNFGVEIDHDKWCVAAHIASLEAGFFVHNVPVTRWSVLKFGYFSLAATSFLLTRLVFAAR